MSASFTILPSLTQKPTVHEGRTAGVGRPWLLMPEDNITPRAQSQWEMTNLLRSIRAEEYGDLGWGPFLLLHSTGRSIEIF